MPMRSRVVLRALLHVLVVTAVAATCTESCVWINELHYDNAGTDVAEFVEVVSMVNNVSAFSLAFYQYTGAPYKTVDLTDATTTVTTAEDGSDIWVHVLKISGLRNGNQDGIALVNSEIENQVIEFLSYEGTITGKSGPAAGITSTSIEVFEDENTLEGHSLARVGRGTMAADFTWRFPTSDSPGEINDHQTIAADSLAAGGSATCSDGLRNQDEVGVDCGGSSCVSCPWINELHYDNGETDVYEFVEVVSMVQDLSGYTLVLYQYQGHPYKSRALGVSTNETSEGSGVWVHVVYIEGIRDGTKDGVALVDGANNVVEFLSYEGTITGKSGPAAEIRSTSIEVFEGRDTQEGHSLARVGRGTMASNFTWRFPTSDSPGEINDHQTIADALAAGGSATCSDEVGVDCGGSSCVSCPWINELHYDNGETDVDEFVEVVSMVQDLSGYTLVLYQYQGHPYKSRALGVSTNETSEGSGVWVHVVYIEGIRDGTKDGVALVDGANNVVEFLSYEGTINGVTGPATGITSTSIEAFEDGNTLEGHSLARVGRGTMASSFEWRFPTSDSPGEINDHQTIAADALAAGGSATCSDGLRNQDEVGVDCGGSSCVSCPWINELHYDNAGTDVDEFVEVVSMVQDLSGYTLVLYQYQGHPYKSRALGVPTTETSEGSGVWVHVVYIEGIRDGTKDGVALVDGANNVVEFLSYEGTINGVTGPAAGVTSTDIEVFEDGNTQEGHSLARVGSGVMASNFTWRPPAPSTPGELNDQQAVVSDDEIVESTCSDGMRNQDEVGVDCGGSCGVSCPWINELHYDNGETDVDEFVEVVSMVNDLSGYTLVLYQYQGHPYKSVPLSVSTKETSEGSGVWVHVVYIEGIRDGTQDGVALVDGANNVIEFLSYEGTINGVSGPAAEITSTSIEAFEDGNTQEGHSLARVGRGTMASSFEWRFPTSDSPGEINDHQTIAADALAAGGSATCSDGLRNQDEVGVDCGGSSCVSCPWINELHYDNGETDVYEFVEVVSMVQDLSGYTLVLYQYQGHPYKSRALGVSTNETSEGSGVWVHVVYIEGIRDGTKDGVALVDGANNVVEFLSYEGTINGVSGPAAGITSIDIEVFADGNTQEGHSLALVGSGTMASNFTWRPPAPSSPGALNDQQTIGDDSGAGDIESTCSDGLRNQDEVGVDCGGSWCVSCPWINELHYDNAGTDVDEFVEVVSMVQDLSGYTLVLYQYQGHPYQSVPLGVSTTETSEGSGVWVHVVSSVHATRNGNKDGVALVDGANNVVEFLSYEGTINGVSGPAAGITSTSIEAFEDGNTLEGHSLARVGRGTTASDFTWRFPTSDSPGEINDHQTIADALAAGGSATCSDGLRNQDEVGVDCGGSWCVSCPWINELHYDNAGTDVDEFVEVVSMVQDLSGYTLVLYQYQGHPYKSRALGVSTNETSEGSGVWVHVVYIEGIRDGTKDGVALVDGANNVVEFLSYEGTINGVTGPAAGIASTDIEVFEDGDTPVGHSLALVNVGLVGVRRNGVDEIPFSWRFPTTRSPGEINDHQSIAAEPFLGGPATCYDGLRNQDEVGVDCGGSSCVPCPWINELHYDNGETDVDEFVEVVSMVQDLSGYTLVLYQYQGHPYKSRALGVSTTETSEGSGVWVHVVYIEGIRDGNKDGVALVDGANNVVEFLSFEGLILGTTGPAAGVWSTDIEVFEDENTPVGHSLARVGSGSSASDFEWRFATVDSPGEINDQQTNLGGAQVVWGTCDDCMRNQDEVGVDCGGSCGPCGWINELHYDNEGTDVAEFVEVVSVVNDLSGYTVVLYQYQGHPYKSVPLSVSTKETSEGSGVWVHVVYIEGIRDGTKDGVALVDGANNVVEFLSYEGTIIGQTGPAAGITSTNIEVFEDGNTPVGHSLARIGGGSGGSAFSWRSAAADSPGEINDGQFVFSKSTCSSRICDFVQSCGADRNATCAASQSTFFKYNDPPTSFAVDTDNDGTCMKTADAKTDTNPQWLSVDLGRVRLVGTVRFWSDSVSAADLEVLVSMDAAAEASALNPTTGAALPSVTGACVVRKAAEPGPVFEATCGAALKGQHVFIRRAAPAQQLTVCGVEVFDHECADTTDVSCPIGYEPSSCEACPGCVPCASGYYSDKEGSYSCTQCPGDPTPYSPAGSTSVFQCEGDAVLDGTSTLEVESVAFNQATDSWEIDVETSIAPRIQINGLSTIFMSQGGAASPANDGTFQAKNFPCRADATVAAGSDLSISLAESVCCLQDMRQGYLTTKIFREYTDGLDLVAANDKCNAADGSDMLKYADLEVVGEAGTEFVDTNGVGFGRAIRLEPTGADTAKIIIPDAELYKVSRSLNPDGNLTDSRELFIGLLDLLPTGTRVVDSASQQISIVLTRTQYGAFASYGSQNIDYDFISFLNARAHKVVDRTADSRRDAPGHQYYAEVSFVYDDRLQPVPTPGPVLLGSVKADGDVDTCTDGLPAGFQDVVTQACATNEQWQGSECPQVSLPDDKFSRIYIPFSEKPSTSTVHIGFELLFADLSGRSASLTVNLDLVVEDFVVWCDSAESSVNLAERVVPRIIVGTESDSPPRLEGWEAMDDGEEFTTGAETLQDGLVTLILDLNETNGQDDNLEVFFEDVLVIHVNPGSQPDVNEIKDAMTGQNSKYMPTYTYDPDTRDARLNIPKALKTDCPAEDATVSFFGCVHKHILRNKEISNATDAYFVGSAPPPAAGAQDFVETMLGDGTAAVAARELGRDFESYLMTEEGVSGASHKSIGLWINPGHKWGGVTANAAHSLSNHLIIYVLFGVRSGVDGSERRMLLQTSADGSSSLVRTLEYNVNAADLVASVMGNVIAIEVEARLALSAAEACLPQRALRQVCAARLRTAVAPHASTLATVECVSVRVENANCAGDEARRAVSAPVAVVDAVIALEEGPSAFLDVDGVVASGGVQAMRQTGGKDLQTLRDDVDAALPGQASEGATHSSSSSNTMVIGAVAGAAAGVALLGLVTWQASHKCRAPAEPLTEVVSTAGVVSSGPMDKVTLEGLLFGGEAAVPGRGAAAQRLLDQP